MTRAPFGSVLSLALLIASSALFTSAASAAWPHDPFIGNVPVATGPNVQLDPRMVTDGAGGFIVVWRDWSDGSRLRAQRVSSTGSLMWNAAGVPLRTTITMQLLHTVISDGAGGVIATWQDTSGATTNIVAQRLNAAGAPLWTADGVVVCSAAGSQRAPVLATDGAGGAIIAWHDFRSGTFTDLFAQRISAAGVPQWTPNGNPVCAASGFQDFPAIASDAAGGAFIAWKDSRFLGSGGTFGVFIQRVSGAGEMQWATNGIQVGFNNAGGALVAADGVGGALVAWTSEDVGPLAIATRVSPSGANLWNLYFGGSQFALGYSRGLVSDGSGGAYALSSSMPTVGTQLTVQRLIANGLVVDGFNFSGPVARDSVRMVGAPNGGVFITWPEGMDSFMDVGAAGFGPNMYWVSGASGAVLDQTNPDLVADSNGGVLVAWEDFRNGQSDIYAQRIGGHGQLGNPEPSIASVRDVPNDQGGKVRLAWNASYMDHESAAIDEYWIWRQAPAALAEAALRHGARLYASAGDKADASPLFDREISAAGVIYWEYVTTQIASQDLGYSIVTATTGDSIAGSNPRTIYRVQAHARFGDEYWNSAPDSGYSVDNLSPASPAPFAGQYAAGTTTLTWNPNVEPDFASYRVYRGAGPNFVPNAVSLIATLTGPGLVDNYGQPRAYKVTAMDIHGNESPVAAYVPAGLVDVDPGKLDAGLWLAAAPNPATQVANLSYTLPGASEVRLEIYDHQGRHVATLERGPRAAGVHHQAWDLRDVAGNLVHSGVYFARLETRFGQRGERFAVIR